MVFSLGLVVDLFHDALPLARRHAAQSRLYRRVVGFGPIGSAVRAENPGRIGLLPFVERRLASAAPRPKASRDRYWHLSVAERGCAPVLHGDQFAADKGRVKPTAAVSHVEKGMGVGQPVRLETPSALCLPPWAGAFAFRVTKLFDRT